MIGHLTIRNLALLESVELELTREFIAITGETGAGKSVLVGALKFLAGSRADKSIVREGAMSVEVEAVLQLEDSSTLDRMLEDAGLPICEEGQLVIVRTLSAQAGKPSKIVINGQMASLQTLQKMGGCWLEYNSPEAVLELYTPEEQLAILDSYGKVGLKDYSVAYEKYKAAKEKLEAAQTTGKLSNDELEFMEKQIEKIDNLRLSADSIEALENEYKRLNNLEQELGVMSDVCEALNNVRAVQGVMARARVLKGMNQEAQPLVERLESLIIELDDQENEWRALADKSDLTLAERERIEGRMGEWMELKRRHGSLEGVMHHREELADKLQVQQNLELFIDQYERELNVAWKAVELEQTKLLKAREAAAEELIKQTVPLLKRLGLPKAVLEADMKRVAPSANGGCEYQLMFNANPGQTVKPLSQIASSGELARVMLALKTVLIKASSKPVIVFDEVDANVGGEVASAVAELLKKLGDKHQVFCITHLPQVAAKANFHLVVRKNLLKNSTCVVIEAVQDERKRLEELARMLGDRNAQTALEHAKVLLGR